VSHWYQGWGRPRSSKPTGPVDNAYRQIKWIRLYRPGPWRIGLFFLGLVALFFPMLIALLIVLLSPAGIVPRLLMGGSLGLIAFGIGTLVNRVYSTGIYVNDSGIRLYTVRGTLTVPWSAVADVSGTDTHVGLLGFPLMRVLGHAVVVTTRDGGPVLTPLTSRGLDFLGRAQAYDAAALAAERWWRDSPRDSEQA
jgi:hypothetical protein